jgi:hypothetical protein
LTIDLSQKVAEQPNLGLHGGASTRAGLLRGRWEGDLGSERVGEGVIFWLSRFKFLPSRSSPGRLELLEGRLGPFEGRMRVQKTIKGATRVAIGGRVGGIPSRNSVRWPLPGWISKP